MSNFFCILLVFIFVSCSSPEANKTKQKKVFNLFQNQDEGKSYPWETDAPAVTGRESTSEGKDSYDDAQTFKSNAEELEGVSDMIDDIHFDLDYTQ
jgi:hypothetical protein|tara:strand:+ start:394 stop:681 length:288 start_codon:yes stop_codon:yes gene_type:complete